MTCFQSSFSCLLTHVGGDVFFKKKTNTELHNYILSTLDFILCHNLPFFHYKTFLLLSNVGGNKQRCRDAPCQTMRIRSCVSSQTTAHHHCHQPWPPWKAIGSPFKSQGRPNTLPSIQGTKRRGIEVLHTAGENFQDLL